MDNIISLPSNFNELLIKFNNTGTTLNIIKDMLSNNYEYYQTGHYHNSTNYSGNSIEISLNGIRFARQTSVGATVENSTATIYYR